MRETLTEILSNKFDKVFILTDTNTHLYCLPMLQLMPGEVTEIRIAAGDENKNLTSLTQIWDSLQEGMATRHSVLINLGGGMITDIGGYAAASFKRGIACINIPTTLLAMVDASIGGKTGINYHQYKNEIGAFHEAEQVIINTDFLQTLNFNNIASGYAEMVKHALLTNKEVWHEHLLFNIMRPNFKQMQRLVNESIDAKKSIVAQDPYEENIRKALNAGHTIGHALETLGLEKQDAQLHGYYVAWGLVAELFLSVSLGFPEEEMRVLFNFVKRTYSPINITCDDYDALYALMQHDKKNMGNDILFTLFENIGKPKINCKVSRKDIFEALDFIREA